MLPGGQDNAHNFREIFGGVSSSSGRVSVISRCCFGSQNPDQYSTLIAKAAIADYTKYLEADKDGMDANRAMALRLRGFSYNTLQQDVKAGEDYMAACMINPMLDVCS